ncbi:protein DETOXIFICATION 27 isoform X2 [Cajanus cajan]|uniref:protein DETOXIFICATION 27 isoform X2 n=1 Tax=Cajanus cajan TaxID=3821 RepID=UPI00098DA53D|nr:protein DETOXIFICATION 27 isoform X2 [Cajanus cajan]
MMKIYFKKIEVIKQRFVELFSNMPNNNTLNETEHPLIRSTPPQPSLFQRTCSESKKLCHIAAPSIFTRLAMFSITVVTQSFAGHLGDLDLAAISIACTVLISITFGFTLGMASALETLCGQAYGAGHHRMLGVYLQRSWLVLFLSSILMLPIFVFAAPLLKLVGQPVAVAEQAGLVAVWLIPFHLSFPFQFTLQRFLQCQLKTAIVAWVSGVALAIHVLVSWVFVYRMRIGIVGTALTIGFSWWISVLGLLGYTLFGGCPDSWSGFSSEAFVGLWDFFKLALASGLMLAVRVANELGAGNAEGAKFATVVSVVITVLVGFVFWLIILFFNKNLALIFTSSSSVIQMVNELSVLLAFTILLNCIQPVLSGVAVGSGRQAIVAYINIGSYYMVGIPLGVLLGWLLPSAIVGMWTGMMSGTVFQTLILAIVTMRYDWQKEVRKAQILIKEEASSNQ